MTETLVYKPCANCNSQHEFVLDNIQDDALICNCGQLIFPSDYGLCEKNYKLEVKLFPPKAN